MIGTQTFPPLVAGRAKDASRFMKLPPCDAEIAVVGKSGARVIQAADFFQGALTTALTPDEIITEVRLPAWPAGRRWGFEEFARRRGDFAMAAAAVFYDQDTHGKACNAHVGVIGAADRPLR